MTFMIYKNQKSNEIFKHFQYLPFFVNKLDYFVQRMERAIKQILSNSFANIARVFIHNVSTSISNQLCIVYDKLAALKSK